LILKIFTDYKLCIWSDETRDDFHVAFVHIVQILTAPASKA